MAFRDGSNEVTRVIIFSKMYLGERKKMFVREILAVWNFCMSEDVWKDVSKMGH